jgi:DNA modification methylase
MENSAKQKKVMVLGKEFNSDEERRSYFRDELRKQLPELKKFEGFPIGEDEDILNLSDPPYYTACPNPWLNDFIAEWEEEKKELPNRQEDFEIDGPFASDVSEGKNNPIYNAHSYHTKVPHPAIMRYILHYTQPGDIVFDGFAGTGMTGVAAQLCSKPDSQLKAKIEQEFRVQGRKPPVWGARKAILGDLSPIASFIAYNYNTPLDILAFEMEANRILIEVTAECGWMYETHHSNGRMGRINYTIWSDIFLCHSCEGEMIFWEVAIDIEAGKVRDEFICPHCLATNTKRNAEKAWKTTYDLALGESLRQTKTKPVLINYSIGNKRHEKELDEKDHVLIAKVEGMVAPYWFPKDRMPEGGESRRNDRTGITHVHHFQTAKNIYGLSAFWNKTKKDRVGHALILAASAASPNFSKMRRFRSGKKGGGPLAGTLYISSIITPQNAPISIDRSKRAISKAFGALTGIQYGNSSTVTGSASNTGIHDNQVDYIFTDPPFGANIMYSELNFIWESWIKVKTNNKEEAIENKSRGKGFSDYTHLMTKGFQEYYRILKPGKWMTVEFSNTNAVIWNGIQIALQRAGFIVANVAALDKKQGSFKAVTTTTAVKQDLVISCYKPSSSFDQRFQQSQHIEVGVWDFVEEHLQHLPVHLVKDNSTTAIIERSPKILYDRLISFYVQRGLPVPIDAGKFQHEMREHFIDRDGMFFTNVQVQEYDRKKAEVPNFVQLSLLVSSEQDGVLWLRNLLENQSLKYQELQPQWMTALGGVRKGDLIPELIEILEENFLKNSQGQWYLPNSENKIDLEELRTNRLLKQFKVLLQEVNSSKNKIKEVRVEAVRAGFKQCYQDKDFKTIMQVGGRIPEKILMEDEILLQFYDIASSKV